MSDKPNESGLAAVAAAADAVSQTDHTAAIAAATAAATADGVKQGSNAAHARIKAILGSVQAKGRDGLASHFAFDTEMTAEQALAALEKSPKVEAPKTGNRLDALVPQPKVEASDKSKLAPADVLAAAVDRQIARQFPGHKTA
jgi:hypothetical protein